MKYFVYILHSPSFDKFYIGQTNDIESRVFRHNKGYVKSTKPYLPWELHHYEIFDNRADAMFRESQIKSWKSKQKIIELIDSNNLK